jgi:beta propeller repeat protein
MHASEAPTVSAVSSEIISGGTDKEIVAERGGERIVVTANDNDDAFPAKDATGNSLVWQGSLSGRWQIFFADLSGTGTPAVIQVTRSGDSNFNPKVDGDSVVWQAWLDGNWEILLADRLVPTSYYTQDAMPTLNNMLGIDNTWHVSRITQNGSHDMFPAISGGLVTWQSYEGNVWSVYAYSTKSGVITKLSDGPKSENPRFSVTWEEVGENGEKRLVGYDIATGEKTDMTAMARGTIDERAPYVPEERHEAPEPVTLPPTTSSVGTSSPAKGGSDDGSEDDIPLDQSFEPEI